MPLFMFLADRLPVGRFTVAYHISDSINIKLLLTNFGSSSLILSSITRSHPGHIPSWDDFVNHYYFPIRTFGTTVIYRRIDHQYAPN